MKCPNCNFGTFLNIKGIVECRRCEMREIRDGYVLCAKCEKYVSFSSVKIINNQQTCPSCYLKKQKV